VANSLSPWAAAWNWLWRHYRRRRRPDRAARSQARPAARRWWHASLPRLIGLEHALNMIVSGAPVPSEKFAGSKLFDEIVDGDVLPAAVKFAQRGRRADRTRRCATEGRHENAEGFLLRPQYRGGRGRISRRR
jgi:hypothetical protein